MATKISLALELGEHLFFLISFLIISGVSCGSLPLFTVAFIRIIELIPNTLKPFVFFLEF